MSLAEFLEAMKECPDAELRDRLGVGDNWPILLGADFSRVVEHSNADRGRWRFNPKLTAGFKVAFVDLGEYRIVDYLPGSVSLYVCSWVTPLPGREALEQQLATEGYRTTMAIDFGDDDLPPIPNTPVSRAVAMAITDVADLLQQHRIRACFPDAKFGSELLRYEPK